MWRHEKHEGAGRDGRLLRVLREEVAGPTGVPLFRNTMALSNMDGKPPKAAKFHGTMCCPEFLAEWAGSGLEVSGACSAFYASSGVSPSSFLGREYLYCMWGVYSLCCIDKLEPLALATTEHLVRRCIQIQKAVKRNPAKPDFSGLESIMRHVSATSTYAYTPSFDKDLADVQRNEGLLMKNARVHRDEVGTESNRNQMQPKGPKKKKGDGEGGDDDDD